jgi:lantibiotic modifying enzyme
MPAVDDRFLSLALEAERFVASLARPTEHGVVWGHSREQPDVVAHALYNGSAGIVIFYLELYAATGEPRFLAQVVAGTDELAAYARAAKRQSCALYSGWPGLAFALAETASVASEPRFGEAAAHCLERLRNSAVAKGAGVAWIEPMPFSEIHGFKGDREIYDASVGAAGAGFALVYATHRALHPEALAWAKAVADRLLEVAERTEGGLNWALMADMPFVWKPSNFAHGAAGVGTFLALLHEATAEPRYLDAARAAAAHLAHIAHRVGDGHLVHHHEGDGESLYYLSACHGPPGTTRLFHVLHRITGEAAYAQWIDGALRGLLATGAPERRTDGFWNNVSQCCGDAGVGDYALQNFRARGDERYLELAVREAHELERRGERVAGAMLWSQAEHRERPRFVQAQTGYMQGAAGIGSFFLHLATTLEGRPVKIAFPDVPFASAYGGR